MDKNKIQEALKDVEKAMMIGGVTKENCGDFENGLCALKAIHTELDTDDWVKVTPETMPKRYDEYICISMKDNCPVHRPYMAVYCTTEGKWYKNGGGIEVVPSHWRPLPANPKE